MSTAIEVITPGLINTIQDLGRFGLRRFGVGTSGVMDKLALRVGNILLGNPEGAAGIEVQIFPFALRFTTDMDFAVTGADCSARLDHVALPPWWATRARAGQVLHLDQPRSGARAYVTVAGGIDVPEVLGSRSTHLRGGFGGHEGRALRAGDRLPAANSISTVLVPGGLGAEPPVSALPLNGDGPDLTIRVLRAGEYDRFDRVSQKRFWSTSWRITPQSDRGGFRLGGPALALAEIVEMRSHGVVTGVVQVPPAGEPIIQMSDANTAGGYPKIAGVIDADLWRLGQAPMGSRLRFKEVEYAEAVDALGQITRYLDRLRQLILLQNEAADRIAGLSRKG
jgi:biotin-dependent carboxylase-like uncharacterized protein